MAERLNAAVLPPPAKRRGPASFTGGKNQKRIFRIVWQVYVLKSDKTGRYYIKHTEALKRRLKQHNDGKTQSLKVYLPVHVVYTEKIPSKQEAYFREKQIKSYK